MAVDKTVQAIQDDVEGNGQCFVPFHTLERVFDKECETDDEEWEELILDFVSNHDWLTECKIDWIDGRVLFIGPYTEPGGP